MCYASKFLISRRKKKNHFVLVANGECNIACINWFCVHLLVNISNGMFLCLTFCHLDIHYPFSPIFCVFESLFLASIIFYPTSVFYIWHQNPSASLDFLTNKIDVPGSKFGILNMTLHIRCGVLSSNSLHCVAGVMLTA